MVFIISNDINAKYLPPNVEVEGFGLPTNLVDEWRCFENIPLSKVVGIAIPLENLKAVLEGKDEFSDEEEIIKLKSCLMQLIDVCNKKGFKIYNSNEKDFTDKIDLQLQCKGRNCGPDK